MRFAHPQWLWAIALIPLFLGAIAYDISARKKRMLLFAAPESWKQIAPLARFDLAKRRLVFWAVSLFWILVALARPQWGESIQETKTTGMDVVFLLDISRSMEAEDLSPDRLRKAKHIIRTVSEGLEGDRVSLIGFAGIADLVCPLTTDIDYFLNRLQTVDPRDIVIQGTDVGSALRLGLTTVERGGESVSNGASRVFILLTDGEDHEDGAISEAARLKEQGIHFFTIGMGTEQGGLIPLKDEGGAVGGYKRDESGQPIMTRPNFEFLKKLASAAEGRFFTASTSESEAFEIRNSLSQLQRGELAARKIPVYNERFQIPLGMGIFFLLLDFALPLLKSRTVRAAVFVLAASSTAHASEWQAYLENKKALKTLEGNPEESLSHFESAVENAPNSPLHQYNRGTAVLGQKEPNLDKALEDLNQSAAAASQQQNFDLATRSRLNQGKIFEQKKDMNAALSSYLDALKDAQKSKDPALEDKVRKNIEHLIQQQPPQQNPKDPKKDQDKKDQDKKDQEQKDKDKQNQDQQKKDQKKEFEQPKKQPFKSEKFSKEDADRVMNELFNKEKEVHSRLRGKKQAPKRKMKDW